WTSRSGRPSSGPLVQTCCRSRGVSIVEPAKCPPRWPVMPQVYHRPACTTSAAGRPDRSQIRIASRIDVTRAENPFDDPPPVRWGDGMTRLHDDEIEVDEELVRLLLGTLSPAYDGLALRRFEVTGSTNALFRLGDDLLVRVPRQPGGTETIEKEQRWLPYVA